MIFFSDFIQVSKSFRCKKPHRLVSYGGFDDFLKDFAVLILRIDIKMFQYQLVSSDVDNLE